MTIDHAVQVRGSAAGVWLCCTVECGWEECLGVTPFFPSELATMAARHILEALGVLLPEDQPVPPPSPQLESDASGLNPSGILRDQSMLP